MSDGSMNESPEEIPDENDGWTPCPECGGIPAIVCVEQRMNTMSSETSLESLRNAFGHEEDAEDDE